MRAYRGLGFRVLGYVLAVVAPWIATYFSFHTDALRGIRLALSFAACAWIAALFGAGPALCAFLMATLAFHHYAVVLQGIPASPLDVLIRTVAALAVGSVLAVLTRQRSTAEHRVLVALNTLQEQTDALMQAQQASGSAAWTFDTRTRVTRWYAGGAEVYGRPHEEITAMGSPTSLVVEEDREKIAAAARLTETTGARFQVEFRITWPDGQIRWLEARGTPMPHDPRFWRGATIDVTDRKRAESALIRTEKLAVAGRLAASIAHEINNPLEAITNLCYLAKHTAVSEETREYIEMAEAELGRVAHITSQTLRFHRQQSAAIATDLAEVLRSIVTLYERRLMQAGIATVIDVRPVEPLVCFAGEMRQVIANLIANAMDAMAPGGTLYLRVRPAADWRTGQPAVRITVADTGCGMSPETQRRIYEAFFTTKGDVGTGLGMWVTAGIVEKHSGALHVRSRTVEGRSGTVFSLLLPYRSTLGAVVEAVSR